MVNINGWINKDHKTQEELLIKANRLNLNQLRLMLDAEFEKRDRILEQEKQIKELRDGSNCKW